MTPFKLILFDLGGVLVELGRMPDLAPWSGGRGDANHLLARWGASPLMHQFEIGRISPRQFAAEMIKEMAIDIDSSHFIRTFTHWPRGVYPGTLKLLERIPGHYRKATLSNTNALHWPRILVEMKLGNIFDSHFPSHLTGNAKPEKGAFDQVSAAFNCSPADILFLDDSAENVAAAGKFGITACRTRGIDAVERTLLSIGIISTKDD